MKPGTRVRHRITGRVGTVQQWQPRNLHAVVGVAWDDEPKSVMLALVRTLEVEC